MSDDVPTWQDLRGSIPEITGGLSVNEYLDLDAAAIARVERLHAPREIDVLPADCADGDCDHEESCPPVAAQQCEQCAEIAETANAYYGEDGRAAVLTLWPCATIRTLRGEDQ